MLAPSPRAGAAKVCRCRSPAGRWLGWTWFLLRRLADSSRQDTLPAPSSGSCGRPCGTGLPQTRDRPHGDMAAPGSRTGWGRDGPRRRRGAWASPHGPYASPPPASSTARSRHGVLRPGERMGANRSAPAVSARRPTSRGSGHGVTVCCFPRSRQGDPVVDEASWRTSGARERNGPPPVAGKRASDMRRGGRI